MSHLDILLPFGLPPQELAADLLRELQAPALATMVSRVTSVNGGRREESFDAFSRMLPHEAWLSRQFGLATEGNSPSIAASLMQSFGLQVSADDGPWFVLQPVHIHVARDHLVLTDPRQLALMENEARVLFDIAYPLFAEVGKRLVYGDAGTWFVQAANWAELKTATPDAASGHNIDIWMPKGPNERDWRKVQNEVQMHWFNHPINEEREAHRLKTVNSLWLWGGTSGRQELRSPYTHAFNFSGWTQALAQHVPHQGLATSADQIVAENPEAGIAILDTLLEPALTNDWGRWLHAMQDLERQWFSPMLGTLKAGAIDNISLIFSHGTRIATVTVTRASLRKFWIKPTLARLCP